jgi:hypothetical protein
MRQRIVINLDEQATAKAKPLKGKRRRWPRVLAVLALLIVIGVVGAGVAGFLLWRRYQSTPTYTLALILDAAQRNDVAEFQKRVDNDEVAKNMTASVSQKAATRYGAALNSSTQQQIDGVMPSLMPRVKQTVQDELLKAMQAFGAAPGQRSFISNLGVVQSLMKVSTDGDSARATGLMAGHNVELGMRRDGDRWKVTAVQDDVIVQRVVDSLMKDLPPIGHIDWFLTLEKKPQRKRSGRRR